MFPREKQFADLLDKQGRKWEYPCQRFDLGSTTYRPDFYLPKERLYIEIVGSRQAYSSNRRKIAQFIKLYPKIKFQVIAFGNDSVKTYFGTVLPIDKRHQDMDYNCSISHPKKCETCKAIGMFWRQKGIKNNKERNLWIENYDKFTNPAKETNAKPNQK
jgi:hypothetical protein